MSTLTDPAGWFIVQVPDGWKSETEDCVTTIRSPHSTGVVFLSAARHVRGRQSSFGRADFLARFLRSLGLKVEDDSIEDEDMRPGRRIYSYAHELNGAHWRYWSVTDDETALLISYTCDS